MCASALGIVRRCPAAIAMVLLGAGQVASAGTFNPPPGCTGFLTVQARGCKVTNHYRCQADNPGEQWRVDFGPNGPYFVSQTDYEAQWLQSLELSVGTRQSLAPDPLDPAMFSDLLRTGIDTFDFRLKHSDGSETRVRGFDQLTGRTVVIDGVALQETAYEFRETASDGRTMQRARGNEYIHPEWRLFLSGPSEWDDGEGWAPMDYSPRSFDFPGDPGFMSTVPIYECEVTLSWLQGRMQNVLPTNAGASNPEKETSDDL